MQRTLRRRVECLCLNGLAWRCEVTLALNSPDERRDPTESMSVEFALLGKKEQKRGAKIAANDARGFFAAAAAAAANADAACAAMID